MFVLREGFFECCNPLSAGEPEFLAQDQHISSRAAGNLFPSASGSLRLYFQKWQSERHDGHVRAVVIVHPGEMEHCQWYNGLSVKLANIGCTTFVLDPQGYGQSDGARGYFERFEDLAADFVEFCRQKYDEVLCTQPRPPNLVLLGKGFGALAVMQTLIELHAQFAEWGVVPSAILVSPAFQFASYIGDQSNVSCGFNAGQCNRQPAAQCARQPVAVAFSPVGEDGPHQKLEQTSKWFPKMIVTQPVDPEMVSRDPQTVDRMNRDLLCWRQGYRSRVLAEIVHMQCELLEEIRDHPEVFEGVPALILHGSSDRLFAVNGSHSIHSTWCDAAQRTGLYPRLKIYDGAFHQLLNEPNKDEVLNDIAFFVASKSS